MMTIALCQLHKLCSDLGVLFPRIGIYAVLILRKIPRLRPATHIDSFYYLSPADSDLICGLDAGSWKFKLIRSMETSQIATLTDKLS
jgi:hypothetical protein